MQIGEIIFPAITVASLLRFRKGGLLKSLGYVTNSLMLIYKRKISALGKANNDINSIKLLADVVRQKTASGHLMRPRGVWVGRNEAIFFTLCYCNSFILSNSNFLIILEIIYSLF